jgi:hypothetical protein
MSFAIEGLFEMFKLYLPEIMSQFSLTMPMNMHHYFRLLGPLYQGFLCYALLKTLSDNMQLHFSARKLDFASMRALLKPFLN